MKIERQFYLLLSFPVKMFLFTILFIHYVIKIFLGDDFDRQSVYNDILFCKTNLDIAVILFYSYLALASL